MNEDNKTLEENIKRHIDVMLESVRSDFRVFGEQLATVSEDVTMLKDDMDYVKTEIVEIKERFKETDRELNKKADKITVNDHEERIVKLETSALVKA